MLDRGRNGTTRKQGHFGGVRKVVDQDPGRHGAPVLTLVHNPREE